MKQKTLFFSGINLIDLHLSLALDSKCILVRALKNEQEEPTMATKS